MQVKDFMTVLETFAPSVYQEGYDNSGLQIGDPASVVTGVLLTLDVTDAIIEEAIHRNCNLVIAHHPLIFSGIKRVTQATYVERVIQKAIRNDINVYAAHTNLDNMLAGVNARIAAKLGLQNTRILSPATGVLSKLYTYVPVDAVAAVQDALFKAGAGNIGKYSECSFSQPGTGTFRPAEDARPTIGTPGGERESVSEVKIEVLVPKHTERQVLKALMESHPYEEVAYEMMQLKNTNQDIGAGMIGTLVEPMTEADFLRVLKEEMRISCIKHTALKESKISKVAICGGSGSFLLKDAIAAQADIFVTSDYKYHQFFDAEDKIVIADIGHYESEQFTIELFADILNEKFPNFAILLSNINTNPVKYFF